MCMHVCSTLVSHGPVILAENVVPLTLSVYAIWTHCRVAIAATTSSFPFSFSCLLHTLASFPLSLICKVSATKRCRHIVIFHANSLSLLLTAITKPKRPMNCVNFSYYPPYVVCYTLQDDICKAIRRTANVLSGVD